MKSLVRIYSIFTFNNSFILQFSRICLHKEHKHFNDFLSRELRQPCTGCKQGHHKKYFLSPQGAVRETIVIGGSSGHMIRTYLLHYQLYLLKMKNY